LEIRLDIVSQTRNTEVCATPSTLQLSSNDLPIRDDRHQCRVCIIDVETADEETSELNMRTCWKFAKRLWHLVICLLSILSFVWCLLSFITYCCLCGE